MSRFSSSACSKTILPLLGLLFAIPFSEPLKGQEVSPFQPRIVGGQVAEQDEFPWIVSLQGPWSCGASLIGPEWILTAAHCVVDDDGNVLPAEDIQLAVGQLYLSEVSTYYAAEQVIVHPGYDSWTMENDIALIRLAQALPESAPTLSLNDDSQVPVPGTDAVVAGWGTLSSGGGSPDRLHKVTVPIVSLEKANDPKAYGGSILPNMLAAGFTEGGKDSCQGDSGGPLVIDINGQMIQVGVVSWGKGCADPYAYGIYTRVSSYTDWIEGLTGLSGGGSPLPVELSILKSPSSKTALPGENVTFSVQAQGEPPLTFQWFFNGQSIAGAQSASLSLPDVGTEDAGDYAVQVTSGEQQVMSEVATLTLAQVISLDEALDQPQWVFNQGADSKQWFGQSIATHDQTDAAQSPLLDHLESASFSTQLDGPGILRFFWKVSSEADYDFLECWVDDVLMHSLSGEVDWQEAKVTLTEGSHEVRWVYRKDEWLSVGQDTAWVDQIHFEALSKLVLLKAPESVVATEGESVTFSVEASGQPPLAYQWYWNQTPIAGAQSPSYTIASVASDDQGDYQVEITSGADTLLSPVATLSLWQTTQLNEALDQASLVFSTDEGDQPWSGPTTWTYDQVDAAQSGVLADGQASILSSVLQGPGILTFYWKVSSEMEYDHLECWVDGTLEGQISGEVDWHEFKIALPDGDHTIQWVYRKDETVSEGEDAGWVDQIQFQVGMALTILQSPASIEVFPGQSASFSVEAHGEAPLLYQWTFNDQPVSGAELPTLEIETVSASDAGVYAVKVSSGSEQVTSATAHLVLIETIPLAEAVDQPDMNFESPQGQPTWSGQSSISHDQVDAAQSPPLDDDAFASFATQLQGPGKLEFYWKVSSEDGWDMLECHVDDQLQRQISGEVDWTPVEIFLSEGMHTVNWVYRKDAYLSEGLDAAWVDQIKYTPGTSGPSVVYSEVFDQASKASAWMVTSLEDPFSSDYEQNSADHYWVASADQSSGIQWELSGNQFLTPSETHPFLHVMTGDYPQKGYHSLAWKFNVSGAISSLDWITLSLYREEGDDLQAAYLDVQPSIDAQGAYSFSAHLGDSNWKLLYEDHMWDLDDVFQGVSSLSLEMTSLIEGQDPAVVQIQAFEIMGLGSGTQGQDAFTGLKIETATDADALWVTHWPEVSGDIYEEWSGHTVFIYDDLDKPGMYLPIAGNAYHIAPHDGLPLAETLSGDLRSKGIESLVWDLSFGGDLNAIHALNVFVYRFGENETQIAYLDLPLPTETGIEQRILAPLDDAGWDLYDQDSSWTLEDVFSDASMIGLSVDGAEDPASSASMTLRSFGALFASGNDGGGGQTMGPVCVDFEAMSLGQHYNSGDAFYADTIGDPSIHEAASVLSFYVKDYVNATGAMISGGGVDVETGNIPHQGNELQISNAVLQIRPNAFHDTMAPPEALPPVSTEDFSGLVLGSNIDEALSGDAVWTKTPPLGWTIDDSGVPGVGLSDQDGISEWAGWSFADKDWWIQAAEDQRRSEFTKGTGAIMIADGDEWSDATHAEGNLNTFLNWSIDVAALDGPLDLKFDSSWLPDAGTDSLGVESNQTAVITVSLDGGQPLEILRWDSDPNSATYHGENTNETIWIQLPSVQGASEMVIRFAILNAANNWWWALITSKSARGWTQAAIPPQAFSITGGGEFYELTRENGGEVSLR